VGKLLGLRFALLTAVTMKITVVWNVTVCSLIEPHAQVTSVVLFSAASSHSLYTTPISFFLTSSYL
jgi:hypothetical protein